MSMELCGSFPQLSNEEFHDRVWHVAEELRIFYSTRLPEKEQKWPRQTVIDMIDKVICRGNSALEGNDRRLSNGQEGERYDAMRDLEVENSLMDIKVLRDKLQNEKARIQDQNRSQSQANAEDNPAERTHEKPDEYKVEHKEDQDVSGDASLTAAVATEETKKKNFRPAAITNPQQTRTSTKKAKTTPNSPPVLEEPIEPN